MLPIIRRKIWPEGILFLFSFVCFSVLESGCNTRESGCLNPEASNFDFTAEKGCDQCCVFPTLSLTLSQKWNDKNFVPTDETKMDTFYDKNRRPYFIMDIRYFLSSWWWKDKDNFLYTIDSTEADCSGQPLAYTPDINLIGPKQFVYPIGTFRAAVEIDSVSFHLGLVEDFSCLDDTLSSTPPILTPESPLWNPVTGALSTIMLILNRNPADTLFDTLFVDIHRPFTLFYPYPLQRGINYSYLLTVNYAMWFEEADVQDLSSFSHSLIQGLDGSFTKTE